MVRGDRGGTPRSEFGVVAEFTGERAVLAVRGAVDASGAPVLGAFIDASIASGYPSVVVDLAATAGDDMVDAALRLVVALARATVGGADGVSVSLSRNGRLSTVAASDQTILEMDADQYATGEGPCVDASVRGHWFHGHALDDESRWPAFIPMAGRLGINAILSTPLLASERPVGALNIYSRTAEAFAPRDQELASVFATEASLILTGAGAGDAGGQLATRLGAALRIRQIIAQAQGVVMERERISADAAYGLLRDFSQGSNQPLADRAEDVVASTQHPRSGPAAVRDRVPGTRRTDPGGQQASDTVGQPRVDDG